MVFTLSINKCKKTGKKLHNFGNFIKKMKNLSFSYKLGNSQ